MTLWLVQSCISLGLGVSVFFLLLVWWFRSSNKNGYLNILTALLGVVTIYCFEHGYYLQSADNRKLQDGELVQWERPLWVGVRSVIYMIAMGISLEADYHGTLIYMVITALIAGCWEGGMLSGTAADKRIDGFWYLMGMTWAFVLLIAQSFYRNRERSADWGFVSISLGAIGIALYGAGWLLGPGFVNAFSGNTEAWLSAVGGVFTTIVPVIITASVIPDVNPLNKAAAAAKERLDRAEKPLKR